MKTLFGKSIVAILLLTAVPALSGQNSVSVLSLSQAEPTIAEDFNGITELTLPSGWRIDRHTSAPRETGRWSDATNVLLHTGGANLASNASNGTYRFVSSSDATDFAVGGLSTSSTTANPSPGTKCVNLMLHIQNAEQLKSITSLAISYDVEKYRNGSNSNGFDVQLYTSTDGENWISAGNDFKTHFVADDNTNGAAQVPIATSAVTGQLLTNVASGEDLFLTWNISVAAGTGCSYAQGLSIDNVAITATFADPAIATPTAIEITPANVVLVPQNPEWVKVLSLNNSLIDYNNQYQMFNDIATAMGKKASWTTHTNLGQPLSYHYNETGDASAKSVISNGYWTHIILQEHSSLPRTDVATFRANVKMWVDFIRANCKNPNAVIILPMNWAYNENGWADFTTQNAALHANYLDVAAELGVIVCPVADAYQNYFELNGGDATAQLYTDNRHPSNAATYLAACMEYALIYNEDATDIVWKPGAVTEDMAAAMRSSASVAMASFTNPVDHFARTAQFAVSVYDQYGNLMPDAEVTLTPSAGSVAGNKYQAPEQLGTYTLTATCGDATGSATIEVAEAEVLNIDPTKNYVYHGYLNLTFKNHHLKGEDNSYNRIITRGAPFTLTLQGSTGEAVYMLDYSCANDIENAPTPQIYYNGFKSLVNEGGGFYSYTFKKTGGYTLDETITFSHYINGVIDQQKKFTLGANDPIEIGAPVNYTFNLSTDVVLSDTPVCMSITAKDSNGYFVNGLPEGTYTCSAPEVQIDGVRAIISDKGHYTINASLVGTSFTASKSFSRLASSGACNLSLRNDVVATADPTASNIANAIDGKTATQMQWTFDVKEETGHYLTIDLGALCEIDAIEVVWEGASATKYTLSLSKNGEDETTSFAETKGVGGSGLTVYRYFYNADFTPFTARHITMVPTTAFDPGWEVKLKELGIHGKLKTPVSYNVEPTMFIHNIDKSVVLQCQISHENFDEVEAYEIWVVEPSVQDEIAGNLEAPRRLPVAGEMLNGEMIVGSASFAPTDDLTACQVPLKALAADDDKHNLRVRAQAVLSDGTHVNSLAYNEGDVDGSTGELDYTVDTSKSDTTTGVEAVSFDSTISAPIEYFNLHGQPVNNPGHGIFIRRQGSSVSKIVI